MLFEKLHNMTNSWAAKLLLGLIAVAFVISGMAGYLFTRVDTFAAKVNGEEISQQVFLQRYEAEFERLSQQLGTQFDEAANSPEFVSGLRQNVLNNLVNEQLLRQYANTLKLGASDEQVKQQIVQSPIFQTEGKFDNALYQRLLQLNHLTPDGYAETVREALRLDQLETGLVRSDFIVPAQQKQLAELFFQQRQVRLAQLPLDAEIAKQNVTEIEVSDYYEANKSAFFVPELAKVQYIELTKEEVERQIEVSDVEVAQYYQDNKALYMIPAQLRLSHIQLATEAEANEVYKALQDGASFAGLAAARSLDKISAQNAGDLSWVSAGAFPKVFEEAANSLQSIGEYSKPVKVDNGFHIILLTDRKAQSVLPLEQVRAQIEHQIRENLVNNQYYALEKQLAEKAFENPESLAKAAEVANLTIKETDYFSQNDMPEGLNYPNVISAIFRSDISQGGVNSEPMNVGEQHSILVRVVDHKPASTRTLAEAKENIEQYLRLEKVQAALLIQAEQLAQQLNQNPNAELPAMVKFAEPETWHFMGNEDPALKSAVFAMKKSAEKANYQAVKSSGGDIFLLELMQIEQGELSPQELQSFAQQVNQLQQLNVQQNLLASLRARAKIEVNRSFIEQQEK